MGIREPRKQEEDIQNNLNPKRKKRWFESPPPTKNERILIGIGAAAALIYNLLSDSPWYWGALAGYFLLSSIFEPTTTAIPKDPPSSPQPEPEPKKPSTQAPPPFHVAPSEKTFADHLNGPHRWPAPNQPKTYSSAGILAIQENTKRKPTSTPSSGEIGETFQFKYQKSDGTISMRRFILRGGTVDRGSQYLKGVCLDANQTRTFRVDRFLSDLTNEDTGEVFTAPDVFSACSASGKVEQERDFIKSGKGARKPRRVPSANGREWVTAVFFAGFRGGKYSELERIAINAGWHVRMQISPTVDYVVANGQAGVKQLAQAEDLGVAVIDEQEFRSLAT